jgi:lipopolysaccharide biosynthesis glycosyltransferase
MKIMLHSQPATFSEGSMWRYIIPEYEQSIFMYCDIDILVNQSLHTFMDNSIENTIYIHCEGPSSNMNYGKLFTEEELSKLEKNSAGFSNGKFIICGKNLHIEFIKIIDNINNTIESEKKTPMLDQHLFNKAVYCLRNCNINTQILCPPYISTNGYSFQKDKTVLLDLMGMYGDGEFHYSKMFDMFLLLSCDGL